jgi:hypothetical protein
MVKITVREVSASSYIIFNILSAAIADFIITHTEPNKHMRNLNVGKKDSSLSSHTATGEEPREVF